MGSLALACSALVAAAAFAVPNKGTYVEASKTAWKAVGGAGEPRNMTAYEDDYDKKQEFNLDIYDEDKRNARSKQRAPLVCFVRYDGFMKSGVMRFAVNGIPVKKCTHVVYSYLETDNRTGEFLYPTRGPLSQTDIEKDVALLKRHQPKLKVLYSYGGGAHTMSMLNRLRTKKDEEKLFKTIDSLVKPLKFDGVNLHLEGPGPSICNKKSFDKILSFIKKVRFKIMHMDDLLTIQLPACRPKCDAIVKRKLARYVDYIFLMTFDYKLDDLSETKLTSGLKSVEGERLSNIGTVACLKQWVDASVPKYKLVPGIATYSRTFTLDDPYSHDIGAKLAEDHPLGYGANFTKDRRLHELRGGLPTLEILPVGAKMGAHGRNGLLALRGPVDQLRRRGKALQRRPGGSGLKEWAAYLCGRWTRTTTRATVWVSSSPLWTACGKRSRDTVPSPPNATQ
ncbi:chitotriosidase-1-like [Dermacentor silvarum]|uniref:chitotriosidase-1-like n=1 Tax=Dermacentor silvarum TaxID=543639 RepID=UPI0021008667|nr:chitotriosidase-1-like [Dermacentor silvarum]